LLSRILYGIHAVISAVILSPPENTTVVQYELYELYDWGKVPELYGTLQWTWNFMELYEF